MRYLFTFQNGKTKTLEGSNSLEALKIAGYKTGQFGEDLYIWNKDYEEWEKVKYDNSKNSD